MMIDDIITLDNDARYYIIDKVTYNSDDYFLSVGLFDNDEPDTDDFVFFKREFENGEETVMVEDNQNTLMQLFSLVINNVANEENKTVEEIASNMKDMLEELKNQEN